VWGVKRKAHALSCNFACGARRQAHAKLHEAEKKQAPIERWTKLVTGSLKSCIVQDLINNRLL